MPVDIVIGLDSLALVLTVGLSLTYGLLVPTAGFSRTDRLSIQRDTFRLLGLCLTLLWLTSLAWLWTRTSAVSGRSVWTALPAVPIVLFRTHFGDVWWLRAAALAWATLALLFMTWRGDRSMRFGLCLFLFGLAWAAASRSASGHAAANGDWTLREGMDWLHLMAISTWGGSLLASLLLVFPRLRHVPVRDQARFAAQFSLLATVALACVLISGIYSAWQMLPAVSAFWTSYYGRLLGIKLLFVAGMVACGAINHYRLVPRLRSAAEDHRAVVRQFQVSVMVESVLLLCVLSVTAMLLGSMPPIA